MNVIILLDVWTFWMHGHIYVCIYVCMYALPSTISTFLLYILVSCCRVPGSYFLRNYCDVSVSYPCLMSGYMFMLLSVHASETLTELDQLKIYDL